MEVFTDTFVPAGLSHESFQWCPRCIWTRLRPAQSLHHQHYVCDSCGRCWYVAHGRLRMVDALTCQGCATRSKHECLSLLGETFPQFGTENMREDEPVPV